MINYETFKELISNLSGEPEIKFIINNINYWLIIYNDKVSFQKENDSNETYYQNLDELYNKVLEKEWLNINDIIVDEIYSFKNDYKDSNYTNKIFNNKNSD